MQNNSFIAIHRILSSAALIACQAHQYMGDRLAEDHECAS